MNNQVLDQQHQFLLDLREKRAWVSIFLVNGIKLQGHLVDFDRYTVVLEHQQKQLIYKHAISTMMRDTASSTSDLSRY